MPIMSKLLGEQSAQTYLTLLQGVLNRFAGNSSNCKTWCVTLVSAILLYSADKKLADGIAIALVPTAFFLFLDAYYLSMERDVVGIYNNFVKDPSEEKLFRVSMSPSRLYRAGATLRAILSFSVFPCYLIIAAALWLCAGLVR
jgi:hypothetical protein